MLHTAPSKYHSACLKYTCISHGIMGREKWKIRVLLENLGVNSNPYQPLCGELCWERQGRDGEEEASWLGAEKEVAVLWDDSSWILLTSNTLFKWQKVAINCSSRFPYSRPLWYLGEQVPFSLGPQPLSGSPLSGSRGSVSTLLTALHIRSR